MEREHLNDELEVSDDSVRQPSLIFDRIVPILALVLVIALVGLIGFSVLSPQTGVNNPSGLTINESGALVDVDPRPADDFTLPLFDGGSIQLSELRGQVVVLNFWASWCPPCREEARDLEAAWRTLRDEGVIFIGINIWDDRDDALAFIEEFGVTYPNGPDESNSIPVDYGLTGIPETFIIDVDGRIAAKFVGPVTAPALIDTVRSVASEATNP